MNYFKEIKIMKLYDELVWRGLIKDISSPELEQKLNEGGLKFYIGTDPTGDSLHLGHYSSFLIIRRLAAAGHIPFILVGGATGLIGDPKATAERELSRRDVIQKNFDSLKAQLMQLFPGVTVVNNYDWCKDINVVDFLRDYGKFITVNYMLAKKHIQDRLDSEDGISYAEFSYMLIQGIDFNYLNEHYGVDMQVAGQDQWGNITTGIEIARKTTGKELYAFTMPLVLDSHGVKFGKTEGNAVWLDAAKTSPYELYQFLLNTEDVMVETYLKRLTFLTRLEIEDIVARHNAEPHLRIGQKALAECIVTDLHGAEAYRRAVAVSEQLFSGDIANIPLSDLMVGFKNVPHFDAVEGKLIDVLVGCGICKSKREANEFLSAGAISVNGTVVKEGDFAISRDNAIEGKAVVIRRGKKKYYLGMFGD